MNVFFCLAIILGILMIMIGGTKGVRSFLSLFLNFAVMILIVLFMTDPNANPIILTLIGCTVISCINLFFINEVNSKTTTAFISTVISIVILLIFIAIIAEKAMIQGFSEEEMEEMGMFSLYIGVDFVKIGASVIIMSTIGAITDVAISITSPMREIFLHHPSISRKELFLSGLSIGKDILGTNTNTLFFAFFGGYLALLLWFKDLSYSIGEMINSKVFSAEMLTIFCAGIGIALIIPIASWLNAHYLIKTRDKAVD
ncbi:YibE/F family protein [Lederbergia galactosidilytica]|uniref:YibE/F n=1 Tax=Lederbergia galactosidilytica TaxID=217031 RepID=A0A177ZM07_9BACI|nr:YibE/F family protein [Lederbergia galactosidilytica]KRG15460.1 YibE/F [Virgibacillus soli]MBP1916246.1 putative membrane protein [Lederbergia galactosidilytica]OAK68360.1 YibE/F [Lederbergia galactosidilytica]